MKAITFVWALGAAMASAFPIRAQNYAPVDDESEVSFTIGSFGLDVNGSVSGLKGNILFNPLDRTPTSFNVSVDVGTVRTGNATRDDHLRKEEFFDYDSFKDISFASAEVKKTDDGFLVKGSLTIKGVTKPIMFPFTLTVHGHDIVFEGEFDIERKDFNIGGGITVGRTVRVNLIVVARPVSSSKKSP